MIELFGNNNFASLPPSRYYSLFLSRKCIENMMITLGLDKRAFDEKLLTTNILGKELPMYGKYWKPRFVISKNWFFLRLVELHIVSKSKKAIKRMYLSPFFIEEEDCTYISPQTM